MNWFGKKSPISFPDEALLKQRQEILRSDEGKAREALKKKLLPAAINRFLEDGVRKYTKRELGAFGKGDWQFIAATLADWEARGLTRILKPLEIADEQDFVIEMLKYVDTEDGFKWPELPAKSA